MRCPAFIIALVCMAGPALAQDWQAREKTDHYAVSGTSGPALYASIGDNGPVVSLGRRTIAYTSWDLKWRRDYQPQSDGSCRLMSALPFLTITYTLPRATDALSGETKARWAKFSDGVTVHEHHHGTLLKAMTDRIIGDTVGLTVADDPHCHKIREAVLYRVKIAFDGYSADSAEFDRVEMSPGGNVHQLILGLVNGF